MKLLLFSYYVLCLGFSVAFIPGRLRQFGDWSSLTHRVITRAGLWSTVLEFLKKNPEYVNKKQISRSLLASLELPGLLKGQIPHLLFRLLKSSKFEDAVDEIEAENVLVDSDEDSQTAAHFDAEQFVRSSRRLVSLKKAVIALINEAGDDEATYATARKQAGRFLHTLQDFYSHSNWIEIGNRAPLKILGDKIIPAGNVAGKETKTCNDCTPATLLRIFFQTDDCQNNLILDTHKLTSGYFGGQDVTKPEKMGKCSHGGVFDSSRTISSKGGINKDSKKRSLSPHYRQHEIAASVAIEATKLFFDSIRERVGDKKFAKFLNMEASRTLSFAIDTTGSMAGEIAGVRKATVQFIENAEADDEQSFFYVLVPFNDPDVGPAYVTREADVAKQTANSLRAHGGGDCPELGLSGLLLALTHSLPNSDVYYFSDASVKDSYLLPSVISIALERQSRIIIFLFGVCASRRARRDSVSQRKLYERLATTTGGQLLEFSKTNIDDAIKLLRRPNVSETNSSLISHEVSLLSVQVEGLPSTIVKKAYTVKCDSSISSMTAVLSADGYANITVVPPKGHNGTISTITQTSTVFSVRIIEPEVGNWIFNITAIGSYSVHLTAQSSMTFRSSLQSEEYSGAFETVLAPILGNPVKGKNLFVTVVPSQQDVMPVDKNITAFIIDKAGTKLDSFYLERGKMLYNNSYYGSVKMKFDEFRLLYVGYDNSGDIVQRLFPRLIKPQEFEMKVKLFSENSSLVIAPNETTTFTVTLHNYGSRQRFSIFVSDQKKFVASYKPSFSILNGNESVDIQINLLAPIDTNDTTISTVSISASIPSSSSSAEDLANFLSLSVSVFSKEFQFLNETELEAVNLTSFLIPTKNHEANSSDALPLYATILLVVGAVLILGSLAAIVAGIVFYKKKTSVRGNSGTTNPAYA